jgi:hypothetical protein
MGENHEMLSYISKDYIHRKHQLPKFSSTNPLFIGSNLKEATTPQILQFQLEEGFNPLVYRLQPDGSSNSLYSPALTGRRLQALDFRLQPKGSSNSLYSLAPT